MEIQLCGITHIFFFHQSLNFSISHIQIKEANSLCWNTKFLRQIVYGFYASFNYVEQYILRIELCPRPVLSILYVYFLLFKRLTFLAWIPVLFKYGP